jgi:Domain of unknown function (DUF4349)
MKPFRDETELAAALRELRPTPRPEFAAELDTRAAAGFPRDSRWGSALARMRERLASTPPRRLLAPAGAVTVAAVVIATAVVATTDTGDPTAPDRTVTALEQARPETGSAASGPESRLGGGQAQGATPMSSKAAEGGSAATNYAGESPTSATSTQGYAEPLPPDSGPYAAQAGRRDIERSAEIVLGADPSEIRADAARVFDAVHAADGIILNSSIRDGEAGTAAADFELLIPSAKLGDALASFSSIAEVRSRHESTLDITAPTVGVGERLRDARATVESLLGQLADADTDEERVAVEARLRSERYRIAALRSRLSSLERRASFSRVSLRIETGAASSSGDDGDAGGWGLGDGVEGAGRVLAVAAGVTVIGLAILAPFGLIALLAWLTRRAWLRRARRDALGRA